MIERIDLSNYQYIFTDEELTGLKKVNYFYGKNGTGKSSLVKAIKEQYSDKYEVHAFQGFDDLIGSDRELNAIALGTDNKEITDQLLDVNRKISNLESDILPSEDMPKNIYEQCKELEEKYADEERKLNGDLSKAAKELKDNKTEFVGAIYYIRNLRGDIGSAQSISDEEEKKQREIYYSKEIDLTGRKVIKLPNAEDLTSLLEATNEIISSSVKPSKIIDELSNNSRKRNFAQMGMEIHSHKDGEICAFCGNRISKERWDLLDSFFSKEVDELKERVSKEISIIEAKRGEFENKIILSESEFHGIFQNRREALELKINNDRNDILNFLTKLLSFLEEKQRDIFIAKEKIDIDVPKDNSENQVELDKLFSENEAFNQNLVKNKSEAQKKLRYNYVFEELKKCQYKEKESELALSRKKVSDINETISERKKDVEVLKKQRDDLIESSRNEYKAAKSINKLIGSLGDNSFTLKHFSSNDGRKGLYKIMDRNGAERSLSTLSTGEKNILAFLWFMYDLNDVNDSNGRDKIVIFDDPVNSNDDNSQYLIMGEIQNLLSQENKPQIFIFTHNNQFYLQIKPDKKKNNRIAFRLRREDKTHISRIGKGYDSDIEPIYQNLWDELRYAYENNKIEFMWNDMRRILETFGRFNYKENTPRNISNYTDVAEDKVLFLALLKSLHVNSHVGYEPDMDLSGRNKEQLLNAFKDVFSSLEADEHFETYWNN